MFTPITIDDFVKSYKSNNPDEKGKDVSAALKESTSAKENGAKCNQCGNPIWAIGTALIGWDGCFTCITGETDNSEDYEIDSVCF